MRIYAFYPAKNTYQILCIFKAVKHIEIPIYTHNTNDLVCRKPEMT